MIRSAFIAACAVGLTGCGGVPSETDADGQAPPEPAPVTRDTAANDTAGDALVQPEWDALDRVGADTCGMRVVRGFLGQPARDIPAERLPEMFRILAPTDNATMDYVEARLNILTDGDGRVIGFKCG